VPDPGRDPSYDDLGLEGRSLTIGEYVQVALQWLDDHMQMPHGDSREQDESLRRAIGHAEALKCLRRFGAGEPWAAIRESTRRPEFG
jgi:hypothetical protein